MAILNNPQEVLVSKKLVAAAPLDSKTIAVDLAERDAIPVLFRYHMMEVAVQSEQKKYQLLNPLDLTVWTEVQTGGGNPSGNNTEIQFNDNGAFGSKSTLYYNNSKDMLVAGASTGLEPDFTGGNANAGSWSAIFGEEHDFTGGGRSANILVAGWKHKIGNSAVGGTYAGASILATGVGHIVDGVLSAVIGLGGETRGRYSLARGATLEDANGFPSGIRVLASGVASVNISRNSAGQTAEHGALADDSVIFGGIDHNIPSDSLRSVILGGNLIKADAATPDTVFMPKLRIGRGTGGALPTTGETHGLGINSATGEVIKIALGGGGGSSSGTNNEVQTSDGAGGFVASKLFFDETTGNMTLGDSGLAGANRTLNAVGSALDIGIKINTKGVGSFTIQKDATDRFVFTKEGFFHFPDTLSASGSGIGFASIYNNSGTIEIINGDVSGSGIKFKLTSIHPTIIPKGASSNITLQSSGTGKYVYLVGDNVSMKGTGINNIGYSTSKVGFYETTAVAKASAMTAQLTEITHTSPTTPDYALQDMTNTSPFGFATKDEANTLLSVIKNLQIRVQELESILDSTTGVGLVA